MFSKLEKRRWWGGFYIVKTFNPPFSRTVQHVTTTSIRNMGLCQLCPYCHQRDYLRAGASDEATLWLRVPQISFNVNSLNVVLILLFLGRIALRCNNDEF